MDKTQNMTELCSVILTLTTGMLWLKLSKIEGNIGRVPFLPAKTLPTSNFFKGTDQFLKFQTKLPNIIT